MQKISLDLDALAVESFDTGAAKAVAREGGDARAWTTDYLKDVLSIAFGQA